MPKDTLAGLSKQIKLRDAFVEGFLGQSPICNICMATLKSYDRACTASLGAACPGFLAIEIAKAHFKEGK